MNAQPPALELTNPGEHIQYRVIDGGIQEREELTPDNRFEQIVEVSYQGPSGTVHKVSMPKRLYTPAYVDQLIEADLHQHEDVHALGAAPHPENAEGGEPGGGIPSM